MAGQVVCQWDVLLVAMSRGVCVCSTTVVPVPTVLQYWVRYYTGYSTWCCVCTAVLHVQWTVRLPLRVGLLPCPILGHPATAYGSRHSTYGLRP